MQSMKILEGDGVLLSQPLLIEQFGRAGAQFLSQLHYWLNHNQNLGINHMGNRWIYNTESQWSEQLKLSVRQVRRYISLFLSKEIIKVEKLNPYKSIRTNYYSINYEKLGCLLDSKKMDDSVNGRNVHEDILSSSSGHDGRMYIQRLSNKELNKSEEQGLEITNQEPDSKNSFKQVKNLKNIVEKSRVGCQEPVSSELQFTEPNKVGDVYAKQASDLEIKKTLPKNNTAQTMLKIWNDSFGQDVKMSKELAPLLVSAHSKKFEKNLNQWKGYCSLIKSSSYLMGERFQLSIFWALKFSTIDRIRSGNLGVKVDAIKENSNAPAISDQQVETMIENLSESERAKETRRKIAKAVGAPMYLSWFHQAQFADRAGCIQLIAPNDFVEQYWETHFDWLDKKQL